MKVRLNKLSPLQWGTIIFLIGILIFLFTYKPKDAIDPIPEITENEIFTQKDNHYLVYFYQPGCIYCNEFKPTLNEYVQQDQHLPVYKINIQNRPELWEQFSIEGTPTILEVRSVDGEKRPYAQYIGVMSLDELNTIPQ